MSRLEDLGNVMVCVVGETSQPDWGEYPSLVGDHNTHFLAELDELGALAWFVEEEGSGALDSQRGVGCLEGQCDL